MPQSNVALRCNEDVGFHAPPTLGWHANTAGGDVHDAQETYPLEYVNSHTEMWSTVVSEAPLLT